MKKLLCFLILINQVSYAQRMTRLDSIISGNFKSEYIYTSGLNTKALDYNRKDEGYPWKVSGKTEYSFDHNGNLILEEGFSWDTILNSWIIENRMIFSWNSRKNMIMQSQFVRVAGDSSSADLRLLNKYENTYDSKGRRTMVLGYSWDQEKNQEVLLGKSEYIFDTAGNNIAGLSYSFNRSTSAFLLTHKSETTFNGNNKPLHVVNYEMDTNSQVFIATSQKIWRYDNKGREILGESSYREKTGHAWFFDTKQERKYEPDSSNIITENYSWNKQSGKWMLTGKEEIGYDRNQNEVHRAMYYWNKEEEKWEGYFKNEYVIDLSVDRSNLLLPLIISGAVKDKLSGSVHYTWNNEWVKNNTYAFYYSDVIISSLEGIRENEKESAFLFPNPATESFTIKSGYGSAVFKIELTDLHGRTVFSRQTGAGIEIPVSDLSKGIYFYTITSSLKTEKGKLLVE